MIPLPDSNTEHKDFFCSSCQTHKKGRLFSHQIKNRRYCTACVLPVKEREEMGILNPYENSAKQRASVKQAPKAYIKPLSTQSLQAITGEHHGVKKSS